MGRFGIAIEVSIASVGSGVSETRESRDKGAIEPGVQAWTRRDSGVDGPVQDSG